MLVGFIHELVPSNRVTLPIHIAKSWTHIAGMPPLLPNISGLLHTIQTFGLCLDCDVGRVTALP